MKCWVNEAVNVAMTGIEGRPCACCIGHTHTLYVCCLTPAAASCTATAAPFFAATAATAAADCCATYSQERHDAACGMVAGYCRQRTTQQVLAELST